ncbi:lasso RiPP family leader peptide-containing protein [Plectonema cf. radiosum LEGE 06105]|uniref:Lasso RiPP family leader peptide-containing protein n=2 Tax=Plectonema TaxID=1183 RepID=A0A8J7F7N1_9CYAN|nr:lasso RiPP family leader peptide-containing protein [Plectonema cf. radiosum LEGE 06105]
MQQLLQIYLVDETALLRDVTEFVKELSKEELLISYDSKELEDESLLKQTFILSKKKRDLATTEEVNKYHQLEEEKTKNIDNLLSYEAPLLRKHGKVNDVTQGSLIPGFRIDSRFAGLRDRS